MDLFWLLEDFGQLNGLVSENPVKSVIKASIDLSLKGEVLDY